MRYTVRRRVENSSFVLSFYFQHSCLLHTKNSIILFLKYVFGYHIKDSLVLKELLIEKMAKNLSKMGGTRVVLQMIFC